MIYITGDTHGINDLDKIKEYFDNEYTSDKDVLFILGDGGFVWDKSDEAIGKLRFSTDATVVYIDGNHENFNLLNDFPVVEKFGAKMHRINDQLYHVLRGEIAIVNGLKFLCFGGATSIDKVYRIPNISWWEEENISNNDIQNAIINLEKYNYCVDYVLTHCAPSKIVKVLGYKSDNNTEILEELSNKITFKKWYFGHYHIDKILNEKFSCFYQNILKLNKPYKYKKNATANVYVEDDDGRLINWDTGRKTKLKYEDLPEYYYSYSSHGRRYIKASGVVDVAFRQSPFGNHIDKDASIYLSYKKKLQHDAIYRPKNSDEWDVSTWRVWLTSFILILEKFNKDLNLHKLKELVNLNYDQYVNDHDFDRQSPLIHPYPNEKPIFYKGSNYYISQGKMVYGVFQDLEKAKKMAELILKDRYLNNYIVDSNENEDEIHYNLIGFNIPSLSIKKINSNDIKEQFFIN